MEKSIGAQVSSAVSGEQRRVGLVYDERMCKHSTPTGEPHPENPERIRAIWNKLLLAKIPQRCVVFDAKEVEDKYISAVHTTNHINLIKTTSSKKSASQRNRLAGKYNSIYFNEGSSESAYLAAGSVLEATAKVAKGELNSAFAIVRPPGHHAEHNEPMGFCLFNNIAIATTFLLNQKELGIKKILIVDWDVHHGNGTQKTFWKDSQVLFFSVHRHENGTFYPCGDDGSHVMTGEGEGAGYNINVPWENGACGDADYIAVWDHILIPVAREFKPDIILISAGFDAAIGDPLGGCRITPHGYSIMLKKLMEFSEGKIVMALEGGYNLNSISKSVLACVEVLLEDKPIDEPSERYPFKSTWNVINAVRKKLSPYWPILSGKLPEKLTNKVTHRFQDASEDSEAIAARRRVLSVPRDSPIEKAREEGKSPAVDVDAHIADEGGDKVKIMSKADIGMSKDDIDKFLKKVPPPNPAFANLTDIEVMLGTHVRLMMAYNYLNEFGMKVIADEAKLKEVQEELESCKARLLVEQEKVLAAEREVENMRKVFENERESFGKHIQELHAEKLDMQKRVADLEAVNLKAKVGMVKVEECHKAKENIMTLLDAEFGFLTGVGQGGSL